jgi:hypothetical protein
MGKPEFDSNQYKIGQRKSWDSVAAGWQNGWIHGKKALTMLAIN